MNKHKIILRLLVSPIILLLLIITYLFSAIKRWVLFLRWGGEWINYDKNDRATIDDIYQELKSKGNKFTKSDMIEFMSYLDVNFDHSETKEHFDIYFNQWLDERINN